MKKILSFFSILLIICLVCCTLIITGCTPLKEADLEPVEQSGVTKSSTNDNVNECPRESDKQETPDKEVSRAANRANEFIEVNISAVGDIMVHAPQIEAQYDQESSSFDFTNNFKFVKPYLLQADLAIGNLETTFGGKEKGYAGFPLFNSPDELADALKCAGFDVISTANNHTFDTGKEGILRTLAILEERGLKAVGTRKSIEDESFLVIDVEGIKLGISAYTYETPRQGEHRALNAIRLPKEVEPLIDRFGFEDLEGDLDKIKERVRLMEQRGAEVIIFFMHWGHEYRRRPNKYQKK